MLYPYPVCLSMHLRDARRDLMDVAVIIDVVVAGCDTGEGGFQNMGLRTTPRGVELCLRIHFGG